MGSAFQILIVDDHEDSAELLSTLLKRTHKDYSVTVSRSFQDAVDVATKHRFDLLLCDIGLPDGDGCELLRQVRAMYPLHAIAMTGHGLPSDIQRYEEAGFNAHLVKPLAWEPLIKTVERVARHRSTDASDAE
jgi:CheY-like chemotaxis protein